jgi:CheY-like chemotaxis protein
MHLCFHVPMHSVAPLPDPVKGASLKSVSGLSQNGARGLVPQEAFARQVKDALTHFYDPVRLQTHPLGDSLVLPQASRETRSQALRQILREAIEALKPANGVPYGRPEWLGYRILWLRYVQSLSPEETADELAISRASFFRHHQDALEAATSLLWERIQHSIAEPPSGAVLAERARQEASKVMQSSTHQPMDLDQVLQGVLRTIHPLAEQQGIALLTTLPDSLPCLYGDATLLRQVILNALVESFKHTASRTFNLTVQVSADESTWRLAGLYLSLAKPEDWRQWPAIASIQGLLDVYGGQLEFAECSQGALEMALVFPLALPKTILLIDDDADAINLLRRYLQARYRLLVAQSGDQLASLLAKARPDLILLDVLLPEEDGWDILQRLKTAPQTSAIPVVICSVLAQPALALALGAAGVLHKPLDQEALLSLIDGLI